MASAACSPGPRSGPPSVLHALFSLQGVERSELLGLLLSFCSPTFPHKPNCDRPTLPLAGLAESRGAGIHVTALTIPAAQVRFAQGSRCKWSGPNWQLGQALGQPGEQMPHYEGPCLPPASAHPTGAGLADYAKSPYIKRLVARQGFPLEYLGESKKTSRGT